MDSDLCNQFSNEAVLPFDHPVMVRKFMRILLSRGLGEVALSFCSTLEKSSPVIKKQFP